MIARQPITPTRLAPVIHAPAPPRTKCATANDRWWRVFAFPTLIVVEDAQSNVVMTVTRTAAGTASAFVIDPKSARIAAALNAANVPWDALVAEAGAVHR